MHSHTNNSTNTKKSTQAKRISVSFESQQETAIMALLAHFGIKFGVNPPRKSCSNCQFFDIETIEVNGKRYDFKAFIEHYIVANNKQLQPDTAHYGKYQKRNMTAATNNVLTDMLKSIGWKISFKNSKEATITLKMERINVLSFGGVVINGEDIALFGEQLNMGLKSVVSQKRDAPLMIGKEELPIDTLFDLSSIVVSAIDLSPIMKMLQPINVSQQIGNNIYCENENTNQLNQFMNACNNTYFNNNNENEEKRNDIEQYVVECSKILDGQNQSQNASQSISGTIINNDNSINQMLWNSVYYGQVNPSVCATPLAAATLQANGYDNKDEIRRERNMINDMNNDFTNDFTKFTEKKEIIENEKYENELPPATNNDETIQMNNHQEFHHTQSSQMTTDMLVNSTVLGDDGKLYYLVYLPMYGWCYYPCQQIIPSIEQTSQNQMNMNMNNVMVEGVEKCEVEEGCVFNIMANYSNAV